MQRLQQQILDARGEALVTKFTIERHRQEAVGVLKDAVGHDRAIPAHRMMETLGDRAATTDQNTNPPISTLGYATALSRGKRGFPSWGVEAIKIRHLSKRRLTKPHGQTVERGVVISAESNFVG
jgi:hypothetical protein